MTRRAAHTFLCVAFVLLCPAAYWAAAAPAGKRFLPYLLTHIALTICAGAVWYLGRRLPPSTARVVVAAGILARLVLIPVPAITTHDPQRYLWDGAVALEGLDPYGVAPNDPALDGLHDTWPTPQEHGHLATLYPPGAVAVFAACAALGPVGGPWAWKGLATLASIAALLLIAAVMYRRDDLSVSNIALIALNPLLLLEVGVGAHLDALAALSIAAAIGLLVKAPRQTRSRAHRAWAGVALGAGALFKLTPIVVLPALAAVLIGDGKDAGRRAAVDLTAAALATVAVGYLLAAILGWSAVGSLLPFLGTWRFGSPVMASLEALVGSAALPLCAAVGALGLVLIAWRARRRVDHNMSIVGAAAASSFALLLMLSPAVFPWYLLPLAVLGSMAPSFFLLVWMTTVPLTYEVIDRFDSSGVWEPAIWPLAVIAGGWLLAAVLDQISSNTLAERPPGC